MATSESSSPEIIVPNGMEKVMGRVRSTIGATATGLLVAYRESSRLKPHYDSHVRYEDQQRRILRRTEQDASVPYQREFGDILAFPGAKAEKVTVTRDYTVSSFHRDDIGELNTGTVAAQFGTEGGWREDTVFQVGISTDAEIAGPTYPDPDSPYASYVSLSYQSITERSADIGLEAGDQSNVPSRDLLVIAAQTGLVIAGSLIEIGEMSGLEGVPDGSEIPELVMRLEDEGIQPHQFRPDFVQTWMNAQTA